MSFARLSTRVYMATTRCANIACIRQQHANTSTKPVTKVGIIGLGNVGRAVAENVHRTSLSGGGYCLTGVLDTNERAVASFIDEATSAANQRASTMPTAGAIAKAANQRASTTVRRYDCSRALTTDVDVIVTCLPEPRDVCRAMEAGVFDGIGTDQVWIDHSTTDYEQTRHFTDIVRAKGADALEAPVTGGMALLKQGQMTVFVGGHRSTFDRCRPLLELSCQNVLYMGEMGTATITKVVRLHTEERERERERERDPFFPISNMLAASHNVVMGEALMMAKQSGVDLTAFFNGIRLSAGNSYVFETEAPLVFNGSYHPDFSLKLHCKDLNLGYELARKFDVPLPVHGLVEQIYNQARIRYGDEAGSSHPVKLMEDSIGVSLKEDNFHDWTYGIQGVQGGSIGVVHKKKTDSC